MQINRSHFHLVFVETYFKINLNLDSFPYSGQQTWFWFFPLFLKQTKKKWTLKAAACERQKNQPLFPSKIIGCSQDSTKKPGHICSVFHARESPYRTTEVLTSLSNNLSYNLFFSFISNYRVTHKLWWVRKISQPHWVITAISRAWHGRPCPRLHPFGPGAHT